MQPEHQSVQFSILCFCSLRLNMFLSLDCIPLQWTSQHKVMLNSTPLIFFIYTALKGAFGKGS